MKSYNYILLDWDGNLARTLDIWLDAFRTVLMNNGVTVSDEDIAESFGAFKEYARNWGVESYHTIFQEADAIAKSKLPAVELYPDALEVLEGLHDKGKKLALITTSPLANVDHLLEKYNLNRLFEAVVTSDDVTHYKPHPEPLETALTLLGGNKEEAIMIGDSDKDLGAAVNTGVDSILFYPEEHRKFYDLDKLKIHNPTYIIEDFLEVLQIV